MVLAVSFFMPWITVGTSQKDLGFSSSMTLIHLYKSVVYAPWGLVNPVLEPILRMAYVFTLVFYCAAMIYGIIFFFRRASAYLVGSAVLAAAAFVSAFFAVNLLRQVWVEYLLAFRLDFGAWVALMAGLVFASSYFLSSKSDSDKSSLDD